MSGEQVLLVDDDRAVTTGLSRALELAGYGVKVAGSRRTALERADAEPFDVIILDLMLPDGDGIEVCRQLRMFSAVPILMLSVRDTVPDRIAGFDAGADDYLVKPFSVDELLARTRALLRRAHPRSNGVLRFAGLELDFGLRVAFRGGEPLGLSTLQFDLLATFMRHPRQALSRQQMSDQVWGEDAAGESNFVDHAVMDLRRQMERGDAPRLIQTVRGYGYALRET